MTLLDAYEVVAWSEGLQAKLSAAFSSLSRKQGLKEEKEWLGIAIERLAAAREGLGDVLARAMRLPELAPLRADYARTLQQAAVEAVEHLEAGISFHAGARSPLVEALYAKLKLPPLRRVDREAFEKFCADFEKRLGSGYAKRMLSDANFAMLTPAVEQVRRSFNAWRGAFSPEPLTDEEASALHDELTTLARQLELPVRQARLLAEAALLPVKNAFEESGVGQRPKRRASKPADATPVPAEEPKPAAEPKPKRKKGK